MTNIKFVLLLLIISIWANGFFVLVNLWDKKIEEEKNISEEIESEEIEEIEKKDFFVETKNFDDFDNIAILSKTWKVDSSQNISLSSNANWRVKEIYVKEGDSISYNQTLAVLDDSISNYWLNLQSAKNNLDKAKLNYESKEVQLDKAISDIKRDLNDSYTSTAWTSSSLELSRKENSIKQLNIDYEKLKVSNVQTKSGYINSLNNSLITLDWYLDDIIDFSDWILWVTNDNRSKNDDFEKYIWTKDSSQKKYTENLLKNIIEYRENYLTNLVINIENDSDYSTYTDIITNSYEKIDELLTALDITLDNSISSSWNLSETQITAYKNSVSTFQSTYNNYISSFVSLKNTISTFLETYIANEESLLKNIENLESDKEIYIKSLDLSIEWIDANLQDAITNKELTLKNLKILIRDAEISYSQALKEYNKLTIKSPISWIVKTVDIDKWQEINSWTKAFWLLNDNSNEVTISFSKDELELVKKGSEVLYVSWDETFTGSILSISQNADENLKYLSRVSLPQWVWYIWNIVNIEIPVTLEHKLLPLNILKINNSWVATLNYLSEEWNLEQFDFNIWKIYSDKVEVLSEITENFKIILTFMDNFDPEKFILKTK